MSYLTNPRKLAFVITLALVGITILLDAILFKLLQGQYLVQILLVLVVLFPLFYFTISYTLEIFIYKKIKLIYKTIHDFKLGKNEKPQTNALNGDLFENVNKEVEEWATKKTAEITHLKQMAQYRREFIGNVSHELKTPIFNIQGYVHTLLDGGIDDKSINIDYLQRTVKSIDRMIAVISDLEKISSLESGVLEIKADSFKIVDLIKEVIDFLEMKLRKNGIKVTISDQSNNTLKVLADKEKIKEVLINLIDNAIKYIGTPQNPHIKIGIFDMDENLLIEVTDNGIGISEQDISRVFERFYRVDRGRSREQGGTGLGLAIVKHIIEAHKQTIHARSKVDVGTTMAFTLRKSN